MSHQIEIEVLMTGKYIPGKPAVYDHFHGVRIPATPARIKDFKIFKFDGHDCRDITSYFEPEELEQREKEYLLECEEQREERGVEAG